MNTIFWNVWWYILVKKKSKRNIIPKQIWCNKKSLLYKTIASKDWFLTQIWKYHYEKI